MVDMFDVSRETMERLQHYVDLLIKWNPRINLIGKSTLQHIWQRHIADSVQIFDIVQEKGPWADIGSGGGLPGIVVAILMKECDEKIQTTLVESDGRKSAFLRTAIRELDLNAQVINDRIETLEPLDAKILSARALADLNVLLSFAHRHLSTDGIALFPKGTTWEKEVAAARDAWSFHLEPIKSATESTAAILKIRSIERV